MLAPAIVIHDFIQAEAALMAARDLRRPVTLTSAVGAIGYLGPRTFLKIVDAAAAAVPEAKFETVVNCGSEPGLALAALRHGATRIAARLSDIAGQQGATILPPVADALDLDGCDSPQKAATAYLMEATENV
jgi:hypothetical protein